MKGALEHCRNVTSWIKRRRRRQSETGLRLVCAVSCYAAIRLVSAHIPQSTDVQRISRYLAYLELDSAEKINRALESRLQITHSVVVAIFLYFLFSHSHSRRTTYPARSVASAGWLPTLDADKFIPRVFRSSPSLILLASTVTYWQRHYTGLRVQRRWALPRIRRQSCYARMSEILRETVTCTVPEAIELAIASWADSMR